VRQAAVRDLLDTQHLQGWQCRLYLGTLVTGRQAKGMAKIHRTVTAGLAGVLGFCVALGLVVLGYLAVYSHRIYPGVSTHGTELGGLTVDEAASLLTSRLPDPTSQTIELRAGEHSWSLSWADTGWAYDYADTAAAAYEVARGGVWHEQLVAPWRVRLQGRSVAPLINPARADHVKATLEELAPQVYVPPTDAGLHISSRGVDPIPAQTGRALDVETSLTEVLEGLENGATAVELAMMEVPPQLPEPEPAYTLAQSLLAQPFTLVVDDPLTDYQAAFDALPEQVGTWLDAIPADDQMVLEVDEAEVRTWLLEIGSQLGSERDLDISETLTRTMAALGDGDHQAQSVVRHPSSTYVVEPGDTLFDIAYRNGFPEWRLEEANPDVEPDELLVGMELKIPSIDVLFPGPLVPGKRIEIDLPEQRLRAFKHDEMVYDFSCSTGMTSTPTIAGQFQVLFKEPEAYAQRWSLDMPYFMAIYYERPGFANGIHELPINAAGQRLWSSVLGWPASYGCIILDVGDAEKLYNWAPVGTLVRIEGVAPGTPSYREPVEEPQ
jgi:LysM repeat protein